MRQLRSVLIACVLTLAVNLPALSQSETPTRVTNQNRSGDLPFSISVGTSIEHVDAASGALNVTVPIVSVPGRGLNAELYYHFNSNYFLLSPRTDSLGRPYWLWTIPRASGWQVNQPDISYKFSRIQCSIPAGYASFSSNLIYTDAAGAKHPLAAQDFSGPCVSSGDPSGPDLGGEGIVGGLYSVILSDGTSVSPGSGEKDANGNQQSSSVDTLGRPLSSTDTLGRSLFTSQNINDANGNPTQTLITVNDANGHSQTYTVNWQQITISTSFGNSSGGYGIVKEITSLSWNVISSIVLPNGKSYNFKYENGTYGEITEIDLPSGGVITYTYANYIDARNTRRYVSSRTETVNGQSATWNFSIPSGQQGSDDDPLTSTVTFPAAGVTPSHQVVYTSIGGAVSDAQIYAGNVGGTPLREYKISYDWDADPFIDNCADPAGVMPPQEPQIVGIRPRVITTILENGLQSKKEFDYETFQYTYHSDHCDLLTLNGPHTFTTSRGNVTAIREYGWGQGTPGALLRTTTKSYLHDPAANPINASSYLAANIVSKVLSETVTDNQNGNTIAAQTQYEFDKTSIVATTNLSAVPGHDATFDSTKTIRGNVTKVKKWRNTDGALLSTTYYYDDLGNIRSIADPLNHTTNWSYDDKWEPATAIASCLPSSNSHAYVSNISNALGQQSVITHYACTGQVQAHQDANDLAAQRAGTTYTYDFMNRPLTTNYADGGQTTLNYNGDALPLTVTKSVLATPNPSVVSDTRYDGLGRVYQTQLHDPEGDVFTDTTYDALGRKQSESNPHRVPTSTTDGTTSYNYDVLDRISDVVRQDGGIVHTDYTANVATVSDETQRQRRSTSDALGRLVEVDEQTSQYVPATPGSPAVAGTGNVTVNGAEQSTQVMTQAATQATGSVTISGAEKRVNPGDCPDPRIACYLYDSGDVSITVNGAPATVSYGQGSDATSIANGLVSAINGNGGYPATAWSSGGTVYLTSKAAGAGANYSLAATYSWDDTDFPTGPSFTTSTSGPNLTGGQDPVYTTVYDSGAVTITVNGHPNSASFGQGSTNGGIASALASNINGDGAAAVTASASGNIVYLTSKATGASSNYSLASSWSYDTGHFGSPSFTATNSGATLTGGVDAVAPVPAHTIWTFSPAYQTLYAYDALGNLTCAEQHGNVSGTGCSSPPASDASSAWRVRRFTYNSLSQLLSAKNPESGTISYSYNDDGVLISRSDARGITTYFSRAGDSSTDALDALHRVHKKSYSSTDPAVNYSYDQTSFNGLTIANGVGRRTGMSDASGQTAWSYDATGRTTDEKRTIGTTPPKTISYQYDLAGSLKQLTYPDGEVVAFANNAAGRPLSAIDSTLNVNFAKNAAYAPTGALSSLQLGSTSTFSGVFACNQYNKRLQPTNIGAFLLSSCPPDFTTPTAAQTVMNLNYDFGLGTADNGNVLSIANRKDTTRSAVFGYDQLNRLTSAQTNSNRWGNTYDYDPWGNLQHKNPVSGKLNAENISQPATSLNRISGYCYDAAGNLLKQGTCPIDLSTAPYQYDADNRITTTAGVTYTYDGDGKRVKKSNGTLYWGDGPLAESDLNGNMLRNFIFFNGKRIARKDASGNVVHYYFADHLGTADVVTTANGSIENESDYYPWGGEMPITTSLANQNYKFTGKERDSETGLDFFGARYYANQMGRWMSPDWSDIPVPVPYADLTDPQSLNLYNYVRNNPIANLDPNGHECSSDSNGNVHCVVRARAEEEPQKEHLYTKAEKPYSIFSGWWQLITTGHFPPASDCATSCYNEWLRFDEVTRALGGAYAATSIGGMEEISEPEPTEVTISHSQSPASARHIDDAQASGQPAVVTLDRSGSQGSARAAARGRAATNGSPTSPGMDRDEYPPKCCAEGGAGASVRSIPRGDNRSAGGQLGQQTRTLADGTKIRIKTGP